MRPLRRSPSSSRTTTLPTSQRASATVSLGSSLRRRRRKRTRTFELEGPGFAVGTPRGIVPGALRLVPLRELLDRVRERGGVELHGENTLALAFDDVQRARREERSR